jgi:hypothetical protein
MGLEGDVSDSNLSIGWLEVRKGNEAEAKRRLRERIVTGLRISHVKNVAEGLTLIGGLAIRGGAFADGVRWIAGSEAIRIESGKPKRKRYWAQRSFKRFGGRVPPDA